MSRYGELPGLDSYLTPDDADERTEAEIQADQDAKDAKAIDAHENRLYEDQKYA